MSRNTAEVLSLGSVSIIALALSAWAYENGVFTAAAKIGICPLYCGILHPRNPLAYSACMRGCIESDQNGE